MYCVLLLANGQLACEIKADTDELYDTLHLVGFLVHGMLFLEKIMSALRYIYILYIHTVHI